MSCDKPLIAAVMLAALAHAACHRTGSGDTSTIGGTVTLVNRVTGDVRCVKGANCAPTVETALRRRMDSAAINVHPDRQTVDLEYEHTANAFSSASFRQAVTEGGGEVLKIGIEACGKIDTIEGKSWITSGSTRLLLDGPGPFNTGTEACVTGELRDQVSPPRLVPGNLSF